MSTVVLFKLPEGEWSFRGGFPLLFTLDCHSNSFCRFSSLKVLLFGHFLQPCTVYDQDRTGKTALHYCCTSDSKRAAQAADYLTMAAPELIETRDEDGFTPLHLAVIAGNTQLVTFLLANGADVFSVDNEKHTVVHWATGK